MGAARIFGVLRGIGTRRADVRRPVPTCIGPIAYTGNDALCRDLANLKAATDAKGVQEAFVTSIAPGSLEMFCRGQNTLLPTRGKFPRGHCHGIACRVPRDRRGRLSRCSSTIRGYLTPGICWNRSRASRNTSATRMLRIEALNHALEGIPEDRVRYHICWGSWHGPHTTDIPLRDIIDVILRVKAQAYSVEAGQRTARARIQNLARGQAAGRKDPDSRCRQPRDQRR